jgi:hypothetical protein
MSDSGAVAAAFLSCLDRAAAAGHPYRHWLLDSILPDDTCAAIDALPVTPPPVGDTKGKRETHNSSRLFFGAEQRVIHPVCNTLASALQSDAVLRRLEGLCGAVLAGSFLRIECCLDTEGFWLEPHTDIGAKLYTMLVYLSDEPGCETWGTDVLDGPETLVATTPYVRNGGLIFIPAADTWHGFHRRPIGGVRRSLIVNYVKPEWRSRHELAFPERPVLL